MKKPAFRSLGALLLVLVSVPSLATTQLYGVGTVNDQLVTIDRATGALTFVGPISRNIVTGLARDPSSNRLFSYQPSSRQLLAVDIETGAATNAGEVVWPTSGVAISGLAFDPASQMLFGSDPDGRRLFRINPETGAAELIGDTGLPVAAIAFDGSGALYGIDTTNLGNNRLVLVDPETGATTDIGATGFGLLQGLAFDTADDTLYAVSSLVTARLVTVSTTTGAGTLVGSLFPDSTGSAFITGLEAVPPAEATSKAVPMNAASQLVLGVLILSTVWRVACVARRARATE